MPQFFALLAGVVVVVIVLFIGLIYYRAHRRMSQEFSNGMPICTSSYAEAAVREQWGVSPFSYIMGLSIIKFENPRATSETADRRECQALVTLSNDKQYPLVYEFLKSSEGKLVIGLSIDGLLPWKPKAEP